MIDNEFGDIGMNVSLVLDESGSAHLTYMRSPGLAYAHHSSTGWEIQLVDIAGRGGEERAAGAPAQRHDRLLPGADAGDLSRRGEDRGREHTPARLPLFPGCRRGTGARSPPQRKRARGRGMSRKVVSNRFPS